MYRYSSSKPTRPNAQKVRLSLACLGYVDADWLQFRPRDQAVDVGRREIVAYDFVGRVDMRHRAPKRKRTWKASSNAEAQLGRLLVMPKIERRGLRPDDRSQRRCRTGTAGQEQSFDSDRFAGS